MSSTRENLIEVIESQNNRAKQDMADEEAKLSRADDGEHVCIAKPLLSAQRRGIEQVLDNQKMSMEWILSGVNGNGKPSGAMIKIGKFEISGLTQFVATVLVLIVAVVFLSIFRHGDISEVREAVQELQGKPTHTASPAE